MLSLGGEQSRQRREEDSLGSRHLNLVIFFQLFLLESRGHQGLLASQVTAPGPHPGCYKVRGFGAGVEPPVSSGAPAGRTASCPAPQPGCLPSGLVGALVLCAVSCGVNELIRVQP